MSAGEGAGTTEFARFLRFECVCRSFRPISHLSNQVSETAISGEWAHQTPCQHALMSLGGNSLICWAIPPNSGVFPPIPLRAHLICSRTVYKVDASARIQVKGRRWKIGRAFIGQRIALRPKEQDSCFGVWFSRFQIGEIDLCVS